MQRLASLAAYHEGIWQKLRAAGAEAYLVRELDPVIARGDEAGEAAGGGGRLHRLTVAVQAIWRGLEQHLREEEEVLVPLLRPVLGDQVGPLASMLQEHRRLQAVGAALFAATNSQGQLNRLEELLALLDDHLRKEKYVLFPLAREVLAPAQRQG
jgi:iron-sulfur cluster repair protein YtfE (RIC family)